MPESELAQILFNFGKSGSYYLVATWGGPVGVYDKTVQGIVEESKRHQRNIQIIGTEFFGSDRYKHQEGVALRVD